VIDPEAITEAKRALGRQLAALREAVGINHHQLAKQIHFGRSTVANAETGYSTCSRRFWEECDTALDAHGVLIRAYEELQALNRQQHRDVAQLMDAKRAATYRQAQHEPARVQVEVVDGEHRQPAEPELAGMADTDLVEFAVVLDRRGISAGTLTAAELTCERLDQHFARSGPDEVFWQVRMLMRGVLGQLRRPQSLSHQRRLVTLAGRLAGLPVPGAVSTSTSTARRSGGTSWP
jgi:DNA-binding XRE family transcriptional regulator